MRLHRSLFFCLLALLLCAGRVHAATVAILRPQQPSAELTEALFRLQGELLAVGFDVTLTAAPPTRADTNQASEALQALAAERGFDAVVAVVGAPKPVAVDIWLFRPPEVELSRVSVDPDAPDAAEALAIRALEVLRSSWLALDLTAQRRARATPRAADTAPQESATTRAPSEPGPFGLEAGVALLAGQRGVSPAVSPLVRFEWLPVASLAVQATLAGLGTRPSIESSAGSVQVARAHALAGLCYCPRSTSALTPVASLAAGALHTGLHGEAQAPNQSHDVSAWSFLLDAGLGARLRLSADYHLTLAAHTELAEPRLAIHVADSVAARAGGPDFLLVLSMGAWL